MKNFQKTLTKILVVLGLFIAMILPYAGDIAYAEDTQTEGGLSNLISNTVSKLASKVNLNSNTVENVGIRYEYNGQWQSYTVPQDGIYKIEAYGGGSPSAAAEQIGKGGKAVGYFYLKKDYIIKILCGEKVKWKFENETATQGSLGGGGAAGNTNGASGAGATGVYLDPQSIGEWYNQDPASRPLLIAGGAAVGADGGGYTGESGYIKSVSSGNIIQLISFLGGSQTKGGDASSNLKSSDAYEDIRKDVFWNAGEDPSNGAIASGGDMNQYYTGYGGGGGYAGGAGVGYKKSGTHYYAYPSGGSSFISTDNRFASSQSKSGFTFKNYTEGGVNLYDGYAIITYMPIYTISCNLNGGEYKKAYDAYGNFIDYFDNPTTYHSESSTFTLNNPIREGYTFTGWTGTGLTKKTKTVTIETGSAGNRTYTANWTPLTYTISYDLDGGSYENYVDGDSYYTGYNPNPTSYTIDTEDFTLINPTKQGGYEFVGWYDTINKKDLGTNVVLPNGRHTNISLQAKYQRVVRADINGQTQYPTVQSAVDAAKSGDTINLLSEIKENVTISGSNKNNLTINLNGHTWGPEVSSDVLTVASNISNLTILDSSNVKYVREQQDEEPVISTTSKMYANGNQTVINNNGSLTIKGITISQEGSGRAIDNNGILNVISNTVKETTTGENIELASDISSETGITLYNLSSATISSAYVQSNTNTAIDNKGNLTIKDYSFVNSISGVALNNSVNNVINNVTITDSDIYSDENIAINNTSYLKINGDSRVISNGEKAINNSGRLEISDDTMVSVSNGPATYNMETNTFTVDVTNEVTICNNESGEIIFNGGYVLSSIDKYNDYAENYEVIIENGTPKTILNKGKITITENDDNFTAIYSNYGIAIYNQNSGTLDLKDGTIFAKDVAIENFSNNVTLTNLEISSLDGIAIHNNQNSSFNLSNSELNGTYNRAIKNEGTAQINNSTVSSSEGIAIENTTNGTLTITDSKISSTYGNAIENKGNLNINGSQDTENTVISNYGTALYNEGKTNLSENIEVLSYAGTAINNVQEGEKLYSDPECNVQINNAQVTGTVLGIYVQITMNTNEGTINWDTKADTVIKVNDNNAKSLYNSIAGDLPHVEKEGYIFKGWFEDSNLENNFINANSILKENKQYYADWLKGSGDYVIVLHTRDGVINTEDYEDGFVTYYSTYTHTYLNDEDSTYQKTFNDVYVIEYKYSWYTNENDWSFDLPIPVKDGEEFDYWADDQGNAKDSYIEPPQCGNMELYASYKNDPAPIPTPQPIGQPYTIKLHAEGGIINGEGIEYNGSVYTMKYISGNEFTIPTPTRGEDTFIGWYNDRGYIVSSTLDSSTTGDKEFWAHWKVSPGVIPGHNICNITLHTDGGTIPNNEIETGRVQEIVKNYTYTMQYREGYGLNQLPIPTKGNENFAGWYDFKTGDKVESISENAIGDKDLNAVWGKNIYKIRIWKQNRNADYEFNYDKVPYMVIVRGGTAGTQITLDDIENIYASEKHTLNREKSTVSGTITQENDLVLDLYFDLNEAKYTVNHYIVSKSGVEELYKYQTKSDSIGKVITPTDEQIQIGGYTLDLSRSTQGTITLGERLIVNLYYKENNDVNYNVKYFVEKEENGLDLNNVNSYVESTEFVGKDYNTKSAKIGTVINLSQITVPEQDGYEVNNNISNIGGILNQDGTITKDGETLPEVRVYLQRKEFSLMLYGNGGKVQGQNVYVTTYKYGSEKQILPTPDNRTDGYTFAGWTLTRDNS